MGCKGSGVMIVNQPIGRSTPFHVVRRVEFPLHNATTRNTEALLSKNSDANPKLQACPPIIPRMPRFGKLTGSDAGKGLRSNHCRSYYNIIATAATGTSVAETTTATASLPRTTVYVSWWCLAPLRATSCYPSSSCN